MKFGAPQLKLPPPSSVPSGSGARSVVIRASHNPAWVIRIDCNCRFVLWRSCRVLIHEDVRGDNGGTIKRARQNMDRCDDAGRRCKTPCFLCLLLDECGEANLQTGSSS